MARVRDDTTAQQEQLSCLTLLRIPQLGPSAFRCLNARLASPLEIFDAGRRQLEALGLSEAAIAAILAPDWRGAEADLEWLHDSGGRLITWNAPEYPPLLKQIPDPPPGLFVQGRAELLTSPQIAVVGSRKPSPAGRRHARQFGADLGRGGITVTSGLAAGIDSQAHEGALEAGAPTLAVFGCGLRTVYPRGNRRLAANIAAAGALVSEFPPAAPPLAANFPRRNRLISGLALGVLVVEAATRSGSLITARLALEQGREVFAVPGSIHNPVARGCHALIREGAKLTETIEDILEEVAPLAAAAGAVVRAAPTPLRDGAGLDGAAKLLLDNIGDAPITVDSLINLTLLPVDEISAALLNLELLGLIETVPGGAYVRR